MLIIIFNLDVIFNSNKGKESTSSKQNHPASNSDTMNMIEYEERDYKPLKMFLDNM